MTDVAIIIPMYNSENYIGDTLKSLIRQTYTDISIICVDDGSTDNTRKIVEKYSQKDGRIKYLYQSNCGAPMARNNGLINSNSRYVLFFDADDILMNNAIEIMVKRIKNDNSDICIGSYEELGGKKLKYYYGNSIFELDEMNIFSVAKLDPLPGNKLYKREVINSKNIRFENLAIGQDLNFFIKYLLICNKVSFINDIVMRYRIVSGSISHTYTLKILKIENSFNQIEKFAEKNNLILNSWYYKVKLMHYTFQYTKSILLKTYSERKKCLCFFERKISYLLEMLDLSKNDIKQITNKYLQKKIVFKILKYPGLCYIYKIYIQRGEEVQK